LKVEALEHLQKLPPLIQNRVLYVVVNYQRVTNSVNGVGLR